MGHPALFSWLPSGSGICIEYLSLHKNLSKN